jgi:hypothetical protein
MYSKMTVTHAPSDTIVLRIIEKDEKSKQGEDHDVYVLYDTYNELFLVRGKRSDSHKICSTPYSFESTSRFAVYSFLSLIIPKENECIVELYNYRDLPTDKNDVTFYFLRENRTIQNEIVAYVNQHISYKSIMNTLFLLQNVTNEYEP